MEVNRKKQKIKSQKTRRLVLLGSLILVICIIAVGYLVQKGTIKIKFPNPFNKSTIVVPIPSSSGQYDIERVLSSKGLTFTSPPVASDSAYIATLSDGTVILLSQTKALDSQVESLQTIQARLTIEGRRAKKIDLRFADPVVVY